jgi:hypothetical protein
LENAVVKFLKKTRLKRLLVLLKVKVADSSYARAATVVDQQQ